MKGIPARYIVTLLCFFGYFSMYAMRYNLSVAIVAMVKEPQASSEAKIEESCLELLDASVHNNNSGSNGSNSNLQGGEFDWDANTRGHVLGAFYYGYAITQIPGGRLAEKYSGKWVCGIGMFVTAILTLVTPFAARGNVWILFAVRLVIGLAQGMMYSALYSIISRWAPKMERSRMWSFSSSGSTVGSAVALVVSGLICDSVLGWQAVFYVFGSIGCIWLILWTLLVYDSPGVHPRISKEELKHISTDQDAKHDKKPEIPWKCILSSVPVWALSITHMCQGWVNLTLMIELPNYLTHILHFNIKSNGVLSAMPHLLFALGSIFASVAADKLRERHPQKTTTIRRIFNSIAFLGAALCMLLVVFAGCRPALIVALLSLSMGIQGFCNSGFLVTHVDMSPEFAATLFGITNFWQSSCGFLTTAYIAWILQEGQSVHRWNIIFITSVAVSVAGAAIFHIFCSAELQNWNTTSKEASSNRDVEMITNSDDKNEHTSSST